MRPLDALRWRGLFRPRALLTAGVWATEFAVLTGFSLIGRYPHALDAGLRRIATTAFGVLLCLAIGRILDRTPMRPTARRWMLALLLALTASLLWALFAYGVIHFRPAGGSAASRQVGFLHEIALNAAALACVFSAWVCGWLAIGYSDALADREARLADAGATGAGRAMWVPTRRGEARLMLDTVERFEAEHDYVRIHARSGQHLVHGALQALCSKLDPERFLRVHRSFVVNLGEIVRVDRRQRGRLELVLASGARVPVGRTYSRIVRTRVLEPGRRGPRPQRGQFHTR